RVLPTATLASFIEPNHPAVVQHQHYSPQEKVKPNPRVFLHPTGTLIPSFDIQLIKLVIPAQFSLEYSSPSCGVRMFRTRNERVRDAELPSLDGDREGGTRAAMGMRNEPTVTITAAAECSGHPRKRGGM
ncbi:hypothetical protein, partial [Halostreptopolyspora alba]|uniref:hypothetical protein n=1 Tax=Halostreptopolyspora alba TaxID=2487137 RepID=UPI003717302A